MRASGAATHISKIFWAAAFFMMACCIPEVAARSCGVHASPHQHSCVFSKSQSVRLSQAHSPYRLSARSVGSRCDALTIISDISERQGRSVWREGLRLSTLEGAQHHLSAARVRKLVQRWWTIENTGDAPMWSKGSVRPRPRSNADQTIYLTTLSHEDYEAIRNAREPMICVPTGPETGHCMAVLPRTKRVTDFLMRGV
jgi:hypothetical protein